MRISENQSYAFGPFTLDPAKRLLKNQGELVSLNSKAFDLLLVLVEESGRVVAKDELMKRLWPDSFVEEGNLSVQVSALRKALGETPNDHQYIVTIPGRGYRFAEPVRTVEWNGDFAVQGEDRSTTQTLGFRRWIGVAIASLLAVSIGAWFYFNSATHKPSLPPPRIIPFTSFPGYEDQPAFSPDGNQLAYSWGGEKDDNRDIYVQLIGVGGEPLRLTQHPDADLCPAWSPDGRYIAFTRRLKGKAGGFLVPALGGHERKLTDIAGAAGLAWSRDGECLVIEDKGSPGEQYGLFVFTILTGERRRLTSPSARAFGDSDPSISPDGKTVAFFRAQRPLYHRHLRRTVYRR